MTDPITPEGGNETNEPQSDKRRLPSWHYAWRAIDSIHSKPTIWRRLFNAAERCASAMLSVKKKLGG